MTQPLPPQEVSGPPLAGREAVEPLSEDVERLLRAVTGAHPQAVNNIRQAIAQREAQVGVLVEALGKERVWQPIETAPMDGTAILVSHPVGGVCEAWALKEDGEWYCVDGTNLVEAKSPSGTVLGLRPALTSFLTPPTHWMPLPSAPSAAREDKP